jgi:hypothetical protein
MALTFTNPGLYFDVREAAPEQSPLRSDVAGFIAQTRRGPIGKPIRVDGWIDFERHFGGLNSGMLAPYAIRGYFENGGQIAHIVRVAGAETRTASASWRVGNLGITGEWSPAAAAGFCHQNYQIFATSPGIWANYLRVSIHYHKQGASGQPEIDIFVKHNDQSVEYIAGIQLKNHDIDSSISKPTSDNQDPLVNQISARSDLIRVKPIGKNLEPLKKSQGPIELNWKLNLTEGGLKESNVEPPRQDDPPRRIDYLNSVRALIGIPEVAIISVPNLHKDLSPAFTLEVLQNLIGEAERLRDRLVLLDLPENLNGSEEAVNWANSIRGNLKIKDRRAAAIYHPHVVVRNPLGSILHPQLSVPPSGHVAGLISRLDRDRGAHHTPANELIENAVDVVETFNTTEQASLINAHINLLRCVPSRGLQVWGGRTLDFESSSRFVAHRRLLHRIVRAIRRVAEPLVFDTNGQEIWLALTQAITTILFEAYRGGALKGVRPEEAFRVRCDAQTNPPEQRDLGRVLCEIEFTPAAPMEVIRLLVTLTREGKLEVFQE